MNRLIVPIFTALCLVAGQAHADFTFPTKSGPFNVIAGTGNTVNFNDAGNSAGVTADTYSMFQMTVDWTAGGGDPWSSEAILSVTTDGGLIGPLTSSAGSNSNSNATTLTFSGSFAQTYDSTANASLDLFLDQTFDGSDANWDNLSLTLLSGVVAPPAVEATLVTPGSGGTNSYTDNAFGSGDVTWVLYEHDGSANEIIIDTLGSGGGLTDTEIGLFDGAGQVIATNDDIDNNNELSAINLTGLAAGDYYIAASTFNTTFGNGWNVTTNGTATGTMVVNVRAVPEPSSLMLIGVVGLSLAYRRRR